ncbi:MAG TPA: putative maltokinase [Bryobacteraceae bacterium]
MTAIDTASLERLLPAYLASRRWFRAKTRRVRQIRVRDVIQLDGCFVISVLEIEYAQGDRDYYLLPLVSSEVSGFDEAALASQDFRNALLAAIADSRTFHGRNGDLVASHTSAFEYTSAPLDSFISRAEQSNTSIIFRDRFILKLFRKIEPGINPDLEIGHFLTQRGFRHTPALLGSLEYRPHGGGPSYAAGMLQQFVKNQGDAWQYTLHSLEAGQPIGEYLPAAQLLGKRTAEMHAALADSQDDPDFAPEPFTPAHAHRIYEETLAQADAVFELLRGKLSSLPEGAAESARQVLAFENAIVNRFAGLKDLAVTNAVRIRYHGDFHLGQVLYTGDDFMIIDFEGEPARPLAERRARGLALRDVAGMLRSFQYAAHAAADGRQSESREAVWNKRVSAAYLDAYFEQARNQLYIPAEKNQRQLLLDAFLLQKAVYEVAYELNNRPDWVNIPLRGILSLIG